jgi:protein subunit release factor A
MQTRKGWKAEIVDEQISDIWGIKDVTVKISGDRVYSSDEIWKWCS